MKKLLLFITLINICGYMNAQCTNPDTTPPVAISQNITAFLDGAGNTLILAADIDGGSFDNCGIANLSASQTSFTCANIGPNFVTLSVVDNSGNPNSDISTVTVLDTISPVAVSQNITVFLDGTGNTSIVAADIDGGSLDNCSIANLSASQTSFSSADLGANNVTLSVTDDSGNSAESISIVTVEESTLGLIENNFNIEPLLYPNPTEGYFTVNLGETYENITVTIKDFKGAKIQSQKYSNIKTLNLNIDESAGVYFLILESRNKKHIIQLVKK